MSAESSSSTAADASTARRSAPVTLALLPLFALSQVTVSVRVEMRWDDGATQTVVVSLTVVTGLTIMVAVLLTVAMRTWVGLDDDEDGVAVTVLTTVVAGIEGETVLCTTMVIGLVETETPLEGFGGAGSFWQTNLALLDCLTRGLAILGSLLNTAESHTPAP